MNVKRSQNRYKEILPLKIKSSGTVLESFFSRDQAAPFNAPLRTAQLQTKHWEPIAEALHVSHQKQKAAGTCSLAHGRLPIGKTCSYVDTQLQEIVKYSTVSFHMCGSPSLNSTKYGSNR